MNKRAGMPSVCDFDVVGTLCPCKGHFLPVVCWIWLLPRPLSASFFKSNFSNQKFIAWNQLQWKYSRSGNEQVLQIAVTESICQHPSFLTGVLFILIAEATQLSLRVSKFRNCHQNKLPALYLQRKALRLTALFDESKAYWSPSEKQKHLGGCDLSCPFTALYMAISHSYCGDLGDDRPSEQM